MKWNDISKEDILGVLGIEPKRSGGERLLGGLGLFGLGLLAGAGAALLLAPKPGAQLRRELGRKLGLELSDEPSANGHSSMEDIVG
jgi:gas vesicle protein